MPQPNRPKPVKIGRKTRMSYGKLKEVLPMPNLIEIQTGSYQWFLKEGLREVLDDFSPINDRDGKLSLEFVDYSLNDPPKYGREECKLRSATYAAPLKVRVRLVNHETGEVKEQEVFMGDFPIMTPQGTFVYNGAERVIVTQLVRSPGVYYDVTTDKSNQKLYSTQIIPTRGAWIEYETDSNGILYVHVDRKKKQPLTVLLKALGLGSSKEIIDVFGDDPLLMKTLEKDSTIDTATALMELYHLQRPDDRPTPESAEAWLRSNLFDDKRYDVAHVGRYKYNKKLGIANRIAGATASQDVIDPDTGEVLVEAGKIISKEKAQELEDLGVPFVYVKGHGQHENEETKVVGNRFVKIDNYIDDPAVDLKALKIPENKVMYTVLQEILDEDLHGDELRRELVRRRDELSPKHISREDIIASVSYLINLRCGIGTTDDIDHLGNRRLRTMGELVQNHFRIGLSRMERVVREKMAQQGSEATTPQQLINIRPVTAAVKEFFGSSQRSQFMDQNNPLSELTHKRKLSALGPGGLSRERAGFEVRDIHHSHYGRMCPIETPEGPNIGLIGSLTTYGRVNEYGFNEAPYRIVDKEKGIVTNEVRYITADEEEPLIIAQANEPLDDEGHFLNEKVAARGVGGEIALYPKEKIDMMDVSPKQVVSVASAMIPFLENDDANRALMGSNMQRQAVPLLVTEAPYVGTGIEYQAAHDSGVVVLAKHSGTVDFVDAETIAIMRDDGEGLDEYSLLKFSRSNQGTCINQRPIVSHGEHIEEGEVIADGPSTSLGEISLGKNLLIGFTTWEGYNYEDAVILNERLVMDDVLTSIHVEEWETEARDTKLGPETITNDIPNPNYNNLNHLTEDGTIAIGTEVKAKDYLVGKTTPKGESDTSPEERLLRAIFGEKARDVKDTSLTVPNGERGIVVDVRTFTRENGDELPAGVNKKVRCYVATKRKIQVGDKMAGRHGNKGVVSRILPEEDMPFLDDGTPLQMMLNPLGVPSRMNVGQVLELHLGLAAHAKGWYVATPVFDGANSEDIQKLLRECDLPENGKLRLRDGRTGEYFEKPISVGYMYMLKLHHLVDDKIHARSSGSYSLVTQQPLGGKAQGGGQRFGEMEVWALEAYGAAYTLQEILTVKSDDIAGRTKTYEMIEQGVNIPEPGVPESFKVLIRELRSLALDVRVFDSDNNEVELKEPDDDGFRRFSRRYDDEEEETPKQEAKPEDRPETDAEAEADADAEPETAGDAESAPDDAAEAGAQDADDAAAGAEEEDTENGSEEE